MKTAIILACYILSAMSTPTKEPLSTGKYKIYQTEHFVVMDIIVTKSQLPEHVLKQHCTANYNQTMEVTTVPLDNKTLIVRVKKRKTLKKPWIE